MKYISNFNKFFESAIPGEEPVLVQKNNNMFSPKGEENGEFKIPFEEAEESKPNNYTNDLVSKIVKYLQPSKTYETLKEFYNKPNVKIPPFIFIHAGTSHTGDDITNYTKGKGRLNYLKDVVTKAFEQLGIRRDLALKFIEDNPSEYSPTKMDRNFENPRKPPVASEREGVIIIHQLETKGLSEDRLGSIISKLVKLSKNEFLNFFTDMDEREIKDTLMGLETYSDIVDLDKKMKQFGFPGPDSRNIGLAAFINKTINEGSYGLTTGGKGPFANRSDWDKALFSEIINHFNKCSQTSSKGRCAELDEYGGNMRIVINTQL